MKDGQPSGLGILYDAKERQVSKGRWSHGIYKEPSKKEEETRLSKIDIVIAQLENRNIELESPSEHDVIKQKHQKNDVSKVRSMLKSIERIEPSPKSALRSDEYSEINFRPSSFQPIPGVKKIKPLPK